MVVGLSGGVGLAILERSGHGGVSGGSLGVSVGSISRGSGGIGGGGLGHVIGNAGLGVGGEVGLLGSSHLGGVDGVVLGGAQAKDSGENNLEGKRKNPKMKRRTLKRSILRI